MVYGEGNKRFMLLAVLSGFALACAAPWLYRVCGKGTGWLLAGLPLGLALYFARWLNALPPRGALPFAAYRWFPSLDIELSFYVDGWSLLFALLISGIGALILIYAGGYLEGHPQLGRLYAFLLMFMASMLGLVLADNLLLLFIFWELTSISSYLLIGFDHERPAARAAALQALLVTGAGGLALLAGLLMLGQAAGSYSLAGLIKQGNTLAAHPLYVPIVVLIVAGAFTKSAQVPFHFWLPSAMEAPTPVSAYLHSATMVKAGVYLLARLGPVLGGSLSWQVLVTTGGAVTMLVGAFLALRQTDLKRLLAYSTVSALGVLVLLIGLGRPEALAAAVVFLLAHALYKGALFLVAGAVDHATGTRDVEQLGGLNRTMPVIALAATVAALSMAGLPPLFGFLAKELLYEAVLHAPAAVWLTGAVVVASICFIALAGVVVVRPFFGPAVETSQHPHPIAPSLGLGPVVLAGLGLLLGLGPKVVERPLLTPAVAALQTAAPGESLQLALWHGWNLALALSGLSLAGGVGLYYYVERLRRWSMPWRLLGRLGPAQGYDLALRGLNSLANFQTRLLQSGYLRYYLMIIIVTAGGLIVSTIVTRTEVLPPLPVAPMRFYEAGVIGLMILAALLTVRSQPRLAAIATLGVVGYSIALFFVLLGAPDLAMTQFLIETLTVILFVLVFYHLPPPKEESVSLARLRDALLASGVGGLMTFLVIVAARVEMDERISGYFVDNSLPLGHGRNIVNVILVDFRGLDTLGEITVLAVAGVGVYALLKLRPRVGVDDKKPSPNAAAERTETREVAP